MGQKDYAQNDYFNDKVRFADICNGVLFHGSELIKPEDLQEMNPDIIYRDNEKKKLRKNIPDKMCMWKGIYISVLALENQSLVDYSMVFRAMKTEAISYEKQFKVMEREYCHQGLIGEKENLAWNVLAKDVRFVPVILIVIYYGMEKIWDGAKCLHDMLNIKEELKPYVTNYKMNLFDYHDYEDFAFFKTDNRVVFEMLSCAKDEKKMDELIRVNRDRYRYLSADVVEFIFLLTGIDLGKLEIVENHEGMEVLDMCKAWDDHWKSGEKAGIMIGEERGIEVFVKDKIMDGMEESSIVKKLVFFYQISDEKAQGYIEKYR